MTHRSAVRLYAVLCLGMAFVLLAAPARAQFQPRPVDQPALGEDYHVEGAFGLWFPTTDALVASEAFGIPGTVINFRTDLGLEDKALPAFRVTLRPARRHKLRFEFIPIKYESRGVLARTIIFNGQRYDIGLLVDSVFTWDAYRFGYEFDFISNDRGFAGFVVEAKYTDVRVDLTTALLLEYARARAPVPALGGIGRVYVRPNISITGELTFFRLPENVVEDSHARYVDFDLYGTFNFTRHVGAQFGYRSLDANYTVDTDIGDLAVKGVYIGFVARY